MLRLWSKGWGCRCIQSIKTTTTLSWASTASYDFFTTDTTEQEIILWRCWIRSFWNPEPQDNWKEEMQLHVKVVRKRSSCLTPSVVQHGCYRANVCTPLPLPMLKRHSNMWWHPGCCLWKVRGIGRDHAGPQEEDYYLSSTIQRLPPLMWRSPNPPEDSDLLSSWFQNSRSPNGEN